MVIPPTLESSAGAKFPRETRLYGREGYSVASFPLEHITKKLARSLITARLNLARNVTGDHIRKQMVESAFEIVDIDNWEEKKYSDMNLLIDVEGQIIGMVLVRRGREHLRLRRFCAGEKEVIDQYLLQLPEMLNYPSEIPLVLRASDYDKEKLNMLFNGGYIAIPESIHVVIRALLTKEKFDKAPVPVHSGLFYSHRIVNSQIDEEDRRNLKQWYLTNTDGDTAHKGRNLKTDFYYEWFVRGRDHKRVAAAGITAINKKTGIVPLALSGDLVVAKEFRNQHLAYPARWLPYFYFFQRPEFQNAVIAIDFDKNNPATKGIFLDRLNCEPISEQLYVTVKKTQ
jgi:hypothetical protein